MLDVISKEFGREFKESFKFTSRKFYTFEQQQQEQQQKQPNRTNLIKLLAKLERILLRFARIGLAMFFMTSEVDLYYYNKYKELTQRERRALMRAHRYRLNWAQLIHRSIIIYLCLKQATLVIFEYFYDFSLMDLEKFKLSLLAEQTSFLEQLFSFSISISNSSSRSSSKCFTRDGEEVCRTATARLAELENRVSQNGQTLKFIGGPFAQVRLIIQCVQVFLVWVGATYYSCTLIYYRFVGPFNVSLIRVIMDAKREQDNIDQLIWEEIDKLVRLDIQNQPLIAAESNVSYNFKPLASESSSSGGGGSNRRRKQAGDLSKTIKNYHERRRQLLIVRSVKRLALTGSLQPPNRQPEWVAKVGVAFASLYTSFIVAGCFQVSGAFAFVFAQYSDHISAAPIDLLCYTETFVLALLLMAISCIGICLLMVVHFDQAYAAYRLSSMIKEASVHFAATFANSCHDLSSQNDWVGHSNCDNWPDDKASTADQRERHQVVIDLQRTTDDNSVVVATQFRSMLIRRSNDYWLRYRIEQLNEELVKILLQYRIFVRQFAPIRHFFNFLALLLTCFYFLYPAYGILHVPYMSKGKCLVVTCLIWTYVVWFHQVTIPLCVYHKLCKRVYQDLFHLMAQVIKLQSIGLDRLFIFDPQIVTLLQREILNPELAMKKVSVLIFGAPFRYHYLMRMDFWTAFVSIYALSAYETRTSRMVQTSANGDANRSSFISILG